MWELVSRKTNKIQYVTDGEYENIKKRGWLSKFHSRKMNERILPTPKIIIPEEKKTTKKTLKK